MDKLDKSAFQDSRNALLSACVQARLQRERGKNAWLDEVLREEEERNGYDQPVPLVNQATFLAMLYSTALWLREIYFNDNEAKRILGKYVKPFVENKNVTVEYGPAARHFTQEKPEQFARRVRNALGHASITIDQNQFTFKDVNSREEDDWVIIGMSWSIVGEYVTALIAAGNELLYSQ